MEDSGFGKFAFTMGGALEVGKNNTPNCKGHLNLVALGMKLIISDFIVKMDGQLAFLYDAILIPLTDFLAR